MPRLRWIAPVAAAVAALCVRAIDRDGNRSPVAATVPANE
jgi:hypothetical protein